jgi:hypothetical protein
MKTLEMWPDPEARAAMIAECIERAKKFLSTPEGREMLEAKLRKTRSELARYERESRIDPAILKEPMTF